MARLSATPLVYSFAIPIRNRRTASPVWLIYFYLHYEPFFDVNCYLTGALITEVLPQDIAPIRVNQWYILIRHYSAAGLT